MIRFPGNKESPFSPLEKFCTGCVLQMWIACEACEATVNTMGRQYEYTVNTK
jgi:hypothetical protein